MPNIEIAAGALAAPAVSVFRLPGLPAAGRPVIDRMRPHVVRFPQQPRGEGAAQREDQAVEVAVARVPFFVDLAKLRQRPTPGLRVDEVDKSARIQLMRTAADVTSLAYETARQLLAERNAPLLAVAVPPVALEAARRRSQRLGRGQEGRHRE